IFQWNCRSVRNKLSHLKITLYTLKPHIVCLYETWLSPNFEPRFVGYTAIYMHRIGAHAGGGVAILVRSDVTYTELQLTKFCPSCLEVLGINIYLQNSTQLSVLCAYNP
ncbi:Endonuclease/exonuclease/phosphatase, partial [Trinorchestia longiramus]